MTRRSFAEIVSDLGLAETMIADVRATIRPKAAASPAMAETVDAPVGTTRRRALEVHDLPRIPIRIPSPADPLAPAEEGADLVVRHLLAEGGMGRLFVAEQRSLSRDVVVKTVRDTGDGAQARALVHEATITGTLEHPNITPVHLVGVDSVGAPLLVMKRISGVAWSALLAGDDDAWRRVPGLSRDRARANLEILMQVASAVHFAHERGIVHRDIKPDNVMVGALGDVYLVDWGIAFERTDDDEPPRELVGTPCFAAPEMLGGGALGPWTDVYLLGTTLHFVLTGRYRHEGNDTMAVLAAAWTSSPVAYPSTVPEELARLANAATAREREARPTSALAFRRALGDYLEHLESLRLADDGTVRVTELAAMRAVDTPNPILQAKLVAEARFAFQRALASWPENVRAREGMRACLHEAIEIELSRENLEGARAIEADLGEIAPALRERIEALAETLRKRAEDAARLEQLDHDSDLGIAARDRLRFLAALTAASLVSGLTLVRGDGRILHADPTSGAAILLASVALALGGLFALLLVRRQILLNRMNRQLVVVVGATVVAVVLHRAFDWWTHADAVVTLRTDLLVVALACSVSAVFVRARMAVSGAILLLCAAITVVVPNATAIVFVVASVGATGGLAWALGGRPPPREP